MPASVIVAAVFGCPAREWILFCLRSVASAPRANRARSSGPAQIPAPAHRRGDEARRVCALPLRSAVALDQAEPGVGLAPAVLCFIGDQSRAFDELTRSFLLRSRHVAAGPLFRGSRASIAAAPVRCSEMARARQCLRPLWANCSGLSPHQPVVGIAVHPNVTRFSSSNVGSSLARRVQSAQLRAQRSSCLHTRAAGKQQLAGLGRLGTACLLPCQDPIN